MSENRDLERLTNPVKEKINLKSRYVTEVEYYQYAQLRKIYFRRTKVNTFPNPDNRVNYASEKYVEYVKDLPYCQVYANGFEKRTYVVEGAGIDLLEETQLEDSIESLIALGFTRMVLSCGNGQVVTRNIP